MVKFNAVLFDLDGTIIASAPGVTSSLQCTLAHFGIFPPHAELMKSLGPPMLDTLKNYLPGEKVPEAMKFYRAEYARSGMYQCSLYPGVEDMLRRLREAGYRIALATSKLHFYAAKTLGNLGIDCYFDVIGGGSVDAGLDTKAKVIENVMEQRQMEECRAVMVGDRMYDMEGARACSLPAIGVLYGYGSAEELGAYQPLFLAQTTQQLCTYLLANMI